MRRAQLHIGGGGVYSLSHLRLPVHPMEKEKGVLGAADLTQ